MIPLNESSSSILEIHSFILFRRVGIADILLDILALSKRIFSEAFCCSSVRVVPSLDSSCPPESVHNTHMVNTLITLGNSILELRKGPCYFASE